MGNEPIAYKVTGMTCGGCARSVENAIRAVAPDAAVEVDQPKGVVTVAGVSETQVAQAVEDAGFTFEGRA
jgi:copper chaperone